MKKFNLWEIIGSLIFVALPFVPIVIIYYFKVS